MLSANQKASEWSSANHIEPKKYQFGSSCKKKWWSWSCRKNKIWNHSFLWIILFHRHRRPNYFSQRNGLKRFFSLFMTSYSGQNWYNSSALVYIDLERCEITTQKLSKVFSFFLWRPVSSRVFKQEKLNVFWHRCQVWDQSHGSPDRPEHNLNQDTIQDRGHEKIMALKLKSNFWPNSICDQVLMTHWLMTTAQHVIKMSPMKKLF